LSSFQLNQQNPYYLTLPTTASASASTHQINAPSVLQKRCNLGTNSYNRKLNNNSVVGDAINEGFNCADLAIWQAENLTRDFLGVVTSDSEEPTRVEELVPLPLIFG
jgi:hypothetical protein